MTISFRTTPTPVSGVTTTLAFTLPTGHTTDDCLIAYGTHKAYTVTVSSGTVTTDYTALAAGANGTVANGNGTGSNYTWARYRIHDGSESDPTGTLSAAPSPCISGMLAATSTNSGSGWTVTSCKGSDTTSTGTTFSATGDASLAFDVDDVLIVITGTPDNVSTPTSLALAASGITFSAVSTLYNGTVADGNDASISVYYATVTAGTATVAPSATMSTSSGDSNGQTTFILLREPVAATNYNGTSSLSATGTVTAAGSVQKRTGTTFSATGTLTAAGLVGTETGASIAATGTITADGSVTGGATSGSAVLDSAGTLTAAGFVGTSTGSALAATDTITAAGTVGLSTGSALAGTGTLTAAGAVGTSTGATLAVTATITSAGTVSGGGLSSSATLAATATITATGQTTLSTGATLAATAALTAAGAVGVASGASIQATANSTATGLVGASSGSVLAATVTITASGQIVVNFYADAVVTATIGPRRNSANLGDRLHSGITGDRLHDAETGDRLHSGATGPRRWEGTL